ncbi:MAG: hypothetical protein IKC77_07045 [Lentisphaeria bacterium]|nr:hypothetical protein [Lentisphaeria bacterium]
MKSHDHEISAYSFFSILFLILFLILFAVVALAFDLGQENNNFSFTALWFFSFMILLLISVLRAKLFAIQKFCTNIKCFVKVSFMKMFVSFMKMFVSFMKMFVFFRSFAQKYKSLREHEKIFFFFSIAAIGLMVSAMLTRYSSGFYTLLRCSVCVAFIGKYFGVRSAFLKFMLLAGAIIYNPVIPVRFDDRDVWSRCNFFAILFLIFLEILSFRRKSNGSA